MKYLCITLIILISVWMIYGYLGVKGVETLPYRIEERKSHYEIRVIPKHIRAKTKVSGFFKQASTTGFRLIADYIFGSNEKNEKIAMTTPVIFAQNEKTFSFVLPKEYILSRLPKPKNTNVFLDEVGEKKYAVITFRGWYSDKKFEKKKAVLIEYLQLDKIEFKEIYFVGYNPPFTPPFMNKMEVWAEIINEKH